VVATDFLFKLLGNGLIRGVDLVDAVFSELYICGAFFVLLDFYVPLLFHELELGVYVVNFIEEVYFVCLEVFDLFFKSDDNLLSKIHPYPPLRQFLLHIILFLESFLLFILHIMPQRLLLTVQFRVSISVYFRRLVTIAFDFELVLHLQQDFLYHSFTTPHRRILLLTLFIILGISPCLAHLRDQFLPRRIQF